MGLFYWFFRSMKRESDSVNCFFRSYASTATAAHPSTAAMVAQRTMAVTQRTHAE